MKITLFSGSGFAWRVQLACVIKGIEYEEDFLNAASGDLKSPKRIWRPGGKNPRGRP